MNKIALLTIAIVSLALFVLPNTISMFVGQHTFEAGVPCQKCHAAEYAELYGAPTIDVHKRAANNTNYTTFLSVGGIEYNSSNSTILTIGGNEWVWNGTWDGGNGTWENGSEHKLVSLDFNGDGEIDGAELCHLCHNSSLFGIEGHAVTVRVCDDDRCHGNRNHAYLGDDTISAGGTSISRSISTCPINHRHTLLEVRSGIRAAMLMEVHSRGGTGHVSPATPMSVRM